MLNETGEIASIGAWQLDLRTRTLKWSRQTCRLHEVAEDYQPDLNTAIEFYASEARPAIAEAVRNAIETGKPPVTLKNATPIARLFADTMILVVPANSPIQTLKDLIDKLKATKNNGEFFDSMRR